MVNALMTSLSQMNATPMPTINMKIAIPWCGRRGEKLAGKFDILFVNSFNLPFFSGFVFFFLLLGVVVFLLPRMAARRATRHSADPAAQARRRTRGLHDVQSVEEKPGPRILERSRLRMIELDEVAALGEIRRAVGVDDLRPHVRGGVAVAPEEVGEDMGVTDGTAIDHIAFSYRDLRPVYERMVAAGVEVVRPIATSPEAAKSTSLSCCAT